MNTDDLEKIVDEVFPAPAWDTYLKVSPGLWTVFVEAQPVSGPRKGVSQRFSREELFKLKAEAEKVVQRSLEQMKERFFRSLSDDQSLHQTFLNGKERYRAQHGHYPKVVHMSPYTWDALIAEQDGPTVSDPRCSERVFGGCRVELDYKEPGFWFS